MSDKMRRSDPKQPIRDTRLVQRLEKPFPSDGPFADNPFSFGGGLKNGGLGDEAMDVLRKVFSFDYMGAAEFEWGAVPAALSSLAKNHKRLVPATITIPHKDVKLPWRFPADKVPEGFATIYVLAYKDELVEVARRIRAWARGEEPSSVEYPGNTMHLKEPTRLHNAILVDEEYPSRVCGWLELDNGFFFFTDEEMWLNTAAIFGVKVPAIVKEVT